MENKILELTRGEIMDLYFVLSLKDNDYACRLQRRPDLFDDQDKADAKRISLLLSKVTNLL